MKNKLKEQFNALGSTFSETFKQVGEVATSQGQDLLHQAMQQGVNIALHGAVGMYKIEDRSNCNTCLKTLTLPIHFAMV